MQWGEMGGPGGDGGWGMGDTIKTKMSHKPEPAPCLCHYLFPMPLRMNHSEEA